MYELFSAFNCAYNTGSLVNSLLGVNIFNSFTSSWLSSGGKPSDFSSSAFTVESTDFSFYNSSKSYASSVKLIGSYLVSILLLLATNKL